MQLFRVLWLSKSAASAAEYALMIALIGSVIVVGATQVGVGAAKAFDHISSALTQ